MKGLATSSVLNSRQFDELARELLFLLAVVPCWLFMVHKWFSYAYPKAPTMARYTVSVTTGIAMLGVLVIPLSSLIGRSVEAVISPDGSKWLDLGRLRNKIAALALVGSQLGVLVIMPVVVIVNLLRRDWVLIVASWVWTAPWSTAVAPVLCLQGLWDRCHTRSSPDARGTDSRADYAAAMRELWVSRWRRQSASVVAWLRSLVCASIIYMVILVAGGVVLTFGTGFTGDAGDGPAAAHLEPASLPGVTRFSGLVGSVTHRPGVARQTSALWPLLVTGPLLGLSRTESAGPRSQNEAEEDQSTAVDVGWSFLRRVVSFPAYAAVAAAGSALTPASLVRMLAALLGTIGISSILVATHLGIRELFAWLLRSEKLYRRFVEFEAVRQADLAHIRVHAILANQPASMGPVEVPGRRGPALQQLVPLLADTAKAAVPSSVFEVARRLSFESERQSLIRWLANDGLNPIMARFVRGAAGYRHAAPLHIPHSRPEGILLAARTLAPQLRSVAFLPVIDGALTHPVMPSPDGRSGPSLARSAVAPSTLGAASPAPFLPLQTQCGSSSLVTWQGQASSSATRGRPASPAASARSGLRRRRPFLEPTDAPPSLSPVSEDGPYSHMESGMSLQFRGWQMPASPTTPSPRNQTTPTLAAHASSAVGRYPENRPSGLAASAVWELLSHQRGFRTSLHDLALAVVDTGDDVQDDEADKEENGWGRDRKLGSLGVRIDDSQTGGGAGKDSIPPQTPRLRASGVGFEMSRVLTEPEASSCSPSIATVAAIPPSRVQKLFRQSPEREVLLDDSPCGSSSSRRSDDEPVAVSARHSRARSSDTSAGSGVAPRSRTSSRSAARGRATSVVGEVLDRLVDTLGLILLDGEVSGVVRRDASRKAKALLLATKRRRLTGAGSEGAGQAAADGSAAGKLLTPAPHPTGRASRPLRQRPTTDLRPGSRGMRRWVSMRWPRAAEAAGASTPGAVYLSDATKRALRTPRDASPAAGPGSVPKALGGTRMRSSSAGLLARSRHAVPPVHDATTSSRVQPETRCFRWLWQILRCGPGAAAGASERDIVAELGAVAAQVLRSRYPLDARADSDTRAVHELQQAKACIVVAAALAEAQFGVHSHRQQLPAVVARWLLATVCAGGIALLGSRIAASGVLMLIAGIDLGRFTAAGGSLAGWLQNGHPLALGRAAELLELTPMVFSLLLVVLGVDRGTKVLGGAFHTAVRVLGQLAEGFSMLRTGLCSLLDLAMRRLPRAAWSGTLVTPPLGRPATEAASSATEASPSRIGALVNSSEAAARESVWEQTARMMGRAILISTASAVWPVAAAWTGIEATGSAAAFFAASGTVPTSAFGSPVVLGCSAFVFGLSICAHALFVFGALCSKQARQPRLRWLADAQ